MYSSEMVQVLAVPPHNPVFNCLMEKGGRDEAGDWCGPDVRVIAAIYFRWRVV